MVEDQIEVEPATSGIGRRRDGLADRRSASLRAVPHARARQDRRVRRAPRERGRFSSSLDKTSTPPASRKTVSSTSAAQLDPGPGVLERHGPVEDQPAWRRIADPRRNIRAARTDTACPARHRARSARPCAPVTHLERHADSGRPDNPRPRPDSRLLNSRS